MSCSFTVKIKDTIHLIHVEKPTETFQKENFLDLM